MSSKNQKLTTEYDIKKWLNKHYIFSALIVEEKDGFIVNSNNDIILNNCALTTLPFRFGVIKGDFSVTGNSLTSLDGCPSYVGGDFDCSFNQLVSLEHCPKFVGGIFNCSRNKLTSLLGAPKGKIPSFSCANNALTSLEGLPNTIGHLVASHNKINSFKFCPKEVSGIFLIHNNPICKDATLAASKNVFKSFLLKHKEIKTIEAENKKLKKILTSPSSLAKDKNINKI